MTFPWIENQSKELFVPVIMAPKYSLYRDGDFEFDTTKSHVEFKDTRRSYTRLAMLATIILLLITNMSIFIRYSTTKEREDPVPQDYGTL